MSHHQEMFSHLQDKLMRFNILIDKEEKMEFKLKLNPDLPKLSWISICPKKSNKVYVYYGPCVEA